MNHMESFMQAGPAIDKKKCSRCKHEMNLEDFVKDKYQATGFKSICKKCNREKALKWRNANPRKARDSLMKWRDENREYWLQYLKHLRNPDKYPFVPKPRDYGRTPEEARRWMKENKKRYDEEHSERISQYVKDNRPRINHTTRQRLKVRRKTDPEYKLKESTRKNFFVWGKSRGIKRTKEYTDLVGCSFEELRLWLEAHFESGMTWDNHGLLDLKKQTWQIDHHYPISQFDFSSEEEQRKCFHYTNLYPMWAKDNNKKKHTVPTSPRENLYIPDFAKVESKVES